MSKLEQVNKLIAELTSDEKRELIGSFISLGGLDNMNVRLEYYLFDLAKICIDTNAEYITLSSELKNIGKTAKIEFTLK